MAAGELLGRFSLTRSIVARLCSYEHLALPTTVVGIRFQNPVGLAAGFDKDARLTRIMPAVGFGFMEVGSVTRNPRMGNPKPRLQRLPRDHALVVHYGLRNDGLDIIERRLAKQRHTIPLCISVAAVRGDEEVYPRLAPVAAIVAAGIFRSVIISSCPFFQSPTKESSYSFKRCFSCCRYFKRHWFLFLAYIV